MDKEQVLNKIQSLASQKQITESDVVNAWRKGALSQGVSFQTMGSQGVKTEDKISERSTSLSKVLYFLGGVVILIGIIIFIQQNWISLGSFGQVLVTLGVGLSAYVGAMILKTRGEVNFASQIFAAIAGILMPFGLGVLLYNMGILVFTAEINLSIAAVMLVIFGVSTFLFKDVVYGFFSIINGTWVYGALVSIMLRNIGYSAYSMHLYQYLIMVLGVAYILIGYSLSKSQSNEYRRLAKTMFFFGTIGFLAPGLTIGGFWDVLYPFLVFGVIILSVYIHNSIFLRFGSVFLMAYLIKVSAKYFSGSFGWPLALVFGGILLMVVGYITYYLNTKYIKNENTIA